MSAAAISLGLLATSTALSAYSTYERAKSEKEIAEYNASVREEDAAAAETQAQEEADLHRDRVRRLMATQRAGYAKAGVTRQGSPLAVLSDTLSEGEKDAMAILAQGMTTASRYRSDAYGYRMTGSAAWKGGQLKTVSTLLTGTSLMTRD